MDGLTGDGSTYCKSQRVCNARAKESATQVSAVLCDHLAVVLTDFTAEGCGVPLTFPAQHAG
jgi:hypothetical protein